MEQLESNYQAELDSLKEAIQASDLLAVHLEEEEETTFQALREAFEPQIESLYERIADEHPLQLTTLEKELLDPGFEGLYLIKILGYSVLRGEIDEEFRYKRPQDHFKEVLLAIVNSSNFDYIRIKIGQTVQIGFALSSEIWVSNLIGQIDNKKVKQFLEEMHQDKFRTANARRVAYLNYHRQFLTHNFHSADFPKSVSELKTMFSALEKFIQYRIKHEKNNKSLLPSLRDFLNNDRFKQEEEYLRMLILFGRYFPHEEHMDWIKGLWNEARTSIPGFNEFYFKYLLDLETKGLPLDKASDSNVHSLLDTSIQDDLLRYTNLMLVIHQKGYIHEDSIESTRQFYEHHEGLSDINESLRHTIYAHFERLLKNLPVEDYKTFTGSDIRKTEDEEPRDEGIARYMKLYMDIFSNQEFNIRLRDLCMTFVQRAMKTFTDKRGAPYQDIKHFVMEKFTEWNFMTEKEVVEFFKTRRKKKPAKA